MRRFRILLLSAVGLFLGGCGGGNSSPKDINGSWQATLTDANSSPTFIFSTTFTQSSGTHVTVNAFTFTTSSPCFVSGETETASFALSGNLNGNATGTFGLTVESGTPTGNTLTLQGTVKNRIISGTWTLAGVPSGCTGNGSFTMTTFI